MLPRRRLGNRHCRRTAARHQGEDRHQRRDTGERGHRDARILQQPRGQRAGVYARRLFPHRRRRTLHPLGRTGFDGTREGPVQDIERQVHRAADDGVAPGGKQIHRRGSRDRRPAQICDGIGSTQHIAAAQMGARQRPGRRYRAVGEESQGSGIHHGSDSGISEGHSRLREDKAHHPAAAPLLDHERRGDQHHEGAPSHRRPQLCRPDRSHVRLLIMQDTY